MKSSDKVEFETGREERLKDEIWKAQLTGNATDPFSEVERPFINPTLMRPGSNAWHVHYALNPFLCYLPLERPFLKLTTSLFRACLVELQSVLKDFKRSLEITQCSVTVWISDAFYFLQQQLQNGILFDFIHTSNLSDHVSLLSLLVSCSPMLKNTDSVIVTESFRWSKHHNTVQEYVRANVFCDPLLLPMIFGVRLAEDFDLGTVTPPYSFFKVVGLAEAIFWMKCERSSNLAIGLDGSSDVKKFLETLVINCCRQISEYNLSAHGEYPYTPLTLIHVLLNMQDYIVGGLSELLQFVDKIFQLKKEQLTNNVLVWNMLCSSLGWKKDGPLNDTDDEILIVKVKFDHHFPGEEDPRAIGFAAVTHLVLKNGVFSVVETFQLGGHSRGTTKHIAMPTFYFDNIECTFRVPILQRDWNKLSGDVNIAMVMFNRIQT